MRLGGSQAAAWRGPCPRWCFPPQLEVMCANPSITAVWPAVWLTEGGLCWGREILLCRGDKVQSPIKDQLWPLLVMFWRCDCMVSCRGWGWGAEGDGWIWQPWLSSSHKGKRHSILCHVCLSICERQFKDLRELRDVGGGNQWGRSKCQFCCCWERRRRRCTEAGAILVP